MLWALSLTRQNELSNSIVLCVQLLSCGEESSVTIAMLIMIVIITCKATVTGDLLTTSLCIMHAGCDCWGVWASVSYTVVSMTVDFTNHIINAQISYSEVETQTVSSCSWFTEECGEEINCDWPVYRAYKHNWANNTPKPQNYALFMLKQDITWVYQGEFPPPSFENVDISRGSSLLCILRLNQVHD